MTGFRTLAIVAACLLGPSALAQQSFSTLEASNAYDPSATLTLNSTTLQAIRVAPTAQAVINHIDLAPRPSNPMTVVASIRTDAAGVPGAAALWSGTVAATAFAVYGIDGPDVILLSGQVYWLVVTATSGSGGWFRCTPPVSGTTAASTTILPWTVASNTILPAARITSTTYGACCSRRSGGCAAISSAQCAALGNQFQGAASVCTPSACPGACPGDFNGVNGPNVTDIFDFLAAWFAGCP